MRMVHGLIMLAAMGCGSVKATQEDAPTADDAPDVDAPIDAPVPLDRQHVLFTANDDNNLTQVFSIRLDGTDKRQITNEAQQVLFAAVSPDGTKVVFTTTIGGNEDLFAINIDGTGRRRLTTNAATDFRPAFSADGLRIAYLSTRDVATFQAYVISFADGDAGQVTRLAPSANQQEFPTMGGANLVSYTEQFPVPNMMATQTDVMLAHEDGTGVVNLTNDPASDSTSSFSRDGTKIVFSSDRAGGSIFQLWMMNADGSNPTQITTDVAMSRFHASFDLSGEHLIYSGSVAGAGNNLFIVSIDGTGETPLTTSADKFVEKLGSWVFAQ